MFRCERKHYVSYLVVKPPTGTWKSGRENKRLLQKLSILLITGQFTNTTSSNIPLRGGGSYLRIHTDM